MPAYRGVPSLAIACHPLPSLAVTAFATAFAATSGLPPARTALLGLAVFTGQLSIGWCNDARDAGRDQQAGRRDKPIARGLISSRTVFTAASIALVTSVLLSFALGRRPGTAHLIMLGGGWAYDLGLKGTRASPLTYLFAFGALPAVATTALPQGGLPPFGVMAGAGLLGVGAHFANTVGDTDADALTGVRGLPQRIGPRRSLVVTAVAVAGAALVLLADLLGRGLPGAGRGWFAVSALIVGALLAGAGVLLGAAATSSGRLAFRLTLGAVAVVVTGFLLGS